MMIAPARFGTTVAAWFAGGGHGLWIDARQGCWRDAGGTIAAAVGDPVRLVTRRAGTKDVAGASDSASPVLQYDAVAGRNYLDFAAASSQVLTVNSGTAADWTEFSNGTEIMVCARVSFGKSANPNALFPLVSTCAIASTSIGANVFWDDRSSVPYNNALRFYLAKGSAPPAPYDVAAMNALPPQQTATISCSLGSIYLNGSLIIAGSPSSAPGGATPNTILTLGKSGTFFADMRLYGLIVLMGAGATGMRPACEAVV